MNAFQITIVGAVIIAAYSFAIVGLVLALSRLLKNVRWRWWLLAPPALLLMALPWAEEAWIAWHFNKACKEAGVTVYRQVEVKGYLDGLSPKKKKSIAIGTYLVPHPVDFEQRGYRYHEEVLIEGGASHEERDGDQLVLSLREKPESRYLVKYHYQPTSHRYEEPIGWKLEKIERQVIDSQSGEIMGRDVRIKRGFPVHEALLLQFVAPPMLICPSPKVKPYTPPLPFPQAVLKPLSRQ